MKKRFASVQAPTRPESARPSAGLSSSSSRPAVNGFKWKRFCAQPSNEEGATEDEMEGKAITGWVLERSLIRSTTQDGDRIIFGEAADSEDQASRRRGRRDAAQDAHAALLPIYDLMPASPLAAEALYRAGDIRWQIERADIMTRPSARERESYMRGQMKEDWMKLVIKKYPGHEMGRPRRLPTARKQTLRRLGRLVEVS